MNMNEFASRFPKFFARYSPFPTQWDRILFAIRALPTDPLLTKEELIGFQIYCQPILKHFFEAYGFSVYNFNQQELELGFNWCPLCRRLNFEHIHSLHKHCPKCKRSVSRTNNCKRCTNCCTHRRCAVCQGCHGHVCGMCKACNKHCECRNYAQVAFIPTSPANRKECKSKRLAGIEWEFNTMDMESVYHKWEDKWGGNCHRDGSCGYEVVTPPAAGDFLVKCIRELGNVFHRSSAYIDHRCGLHVHVDARDVRWVDMYRLLYVYSRVEPILYLLGGQERVINRYCRPCGEGYAQALVQKDVKSAIMSVAFDNGYDPRVYQKGFPRKRDKGRYRGLNLMPWLVGRRSALVNHDATVEFRLHEGTLETERVVKWTTLCVRLVDWAVQATDADLKNLPQTALQILCAVAPEHKAWILEKVRQWRIERPIIMGKYHRYFSNKNGHWTIVMT